uniref:Uncharacterized protein n=1 Tax=Arundo donax TaxID=35708 RepID=A0A0A9BHP7_ARUDO
MKDSSSHVTLSGLSARSDPLFLLFPLFSSFLLIVAIITSIVVCLAMSSIWVIWLVRLTVMTYVLSSLIFLTLSGHTDSEIDV